VLLFWGKVYIETCYTLIFISLFSQISHLKWPSKKWFHFSEDNFNPSKIKTVTNHIFTSLITLTYIFCKCKGDFASTEDILVSAIQPFNEYLSKIFNINLPSFQNVLINHIKKFKIVLSWTFYPFLVSILTLKLWEELVNFIGEEHTLISIHLQSNVILCNLRNDRNCNKEH